METVLLLVIMKERADWMAWILQFLAGLAVGAVFAFLFLAKDRSGQSYNWSGARLGFFIGGVSLLCAALASFFGDRLWFGLGDHCSGLFRPNEMRQSPTSRMVSVVAGLSGGALLLVSFS